MPIKRKYISVPSGSVQAICNELNVGRTCVYDALNYTTNNENAQHIRRLALSTYGGVEATKVIW